MLKFGLLVNAHKMSCGRGDLGCREGRIKVQTHCRVSIPADLPIDCPLLAVCVGPKLISWSPFKQ